MNLPSVEFLALDGVLKIVPARFADARGYFSEIYNKDSFGKIGVDHTFIQDNQALSTETGTIRGLHFQIGGTAQAKLVRVVRGAIFDVAVDLRHGSPTFGKSCAVTISATDGAQFFVPAGFAHGYCTLEPDTEVAYKVDAPYSRADERGLLWDDPALGIDWPVNQRAARVIERDRLLPRLRDLEVFFTYSANGDVA